MALRTYFGRKPSQFFKKLVIAKFSKNELFDQKLESKNVLSGPSLGSGVTLVISVCGHRGN